MEKNIYFVIFFLGKFAFPFSIEDSPISWGSVGTKEYFLHQEFMSRPQAETFCTDQQLRLGAVETEAEATFLAQKIDDTELVFSRLWLSARRDREPAGRLFWESTNEELDTQLFHEIRTIGISFPIPFSKYGALNGQYDTKPNLLLTSESTILDGVICETVGTPATTTTEHTTTELIEPTTTIPPTNPRRRPSALETYLVCCSS